MISKVKVDDIKPNPFQLRKSQDEESIKSLADEIGQVGLWAGAFRGRESNGHVQLCFGHRRLEAIKRLGWKEVEIDLVQLSDEDMAIQGLIENLQREGLTDADKADAAVAYIKLRSGDKKDHGRTTKIKEDLSALLGWHVSYIEGLVRLAGFTEPVKDLIRSKKIAGSAAMEADRIAGEDGVKAAAKEGLSAHKVKAIGEQVRKIKDDDVRAKVKEKFVKGTIKTPEEVVKNARQLEGKKKASEPKLPPDLLLVVGNWTVQINEWTKQLDVIIDGEHVKYIDTQPKVAEKFRTAVGELVARLNKFL